MYICMHVYVCVCVHMYVGMYVYMWCKLNHNRKHILCVSYTVVIMYAALTIFSAVCVIYIIYCLSWGFYGCDKTPRPKSICREKGLFYLPAWSSSSREVRAQTGREKLMQRPQLRAGLLFMACSACFLTTPGKTARAWHPHSKLSPLTSIINEENAP